MIGRMKTDSRFACLFAAALLAAGCASPSVSGNVAEQVKSTQPVFVSTEADGIVVRSDKGTQRATIVWEAPGPVALPSVPLGKRPRNIIMIIGDGMGFGARELASLRCHGRCEALCMDRLPHAAIVTTHSLNSQRTDSTAAGTALATGHKTNNRMMSVVPVPGATNEVVSIATLAHRAGKGIGLLTSDYMASATPGVFYAHNSDREATDAIIRDLAGCGFEVFYGNDATIKAFRENQVTGTDLEAEMKARGVVFTQTHEDFLAAARKPGAKVVGHVPNAEFMTEAGRPKILGEALEATLANLSANPSGFFIMAESCNPDHGGHGFEGEKAMELDVLGTIQCDWLAKVALEFAAPRGDTLVLVLADHETGAILAARGTEDPEPAIYHGEGGHTGTPIPLTAYGPGSELFTGLLDNTDVPRLLAHLWGYRLDP